MSEPPRAVVITNVAPMRAEPGTRAEQVSQALFGETVRVGDRRGDFGLCETPDGYAGWIWLARLRAIGRGDRYPATGREAIVRRLFAPVTSEPSARADRIALLSVGSRIELAGNCAHGYRAIRLPDGALGWVPAPAIGSLSVTRARNWGTAAARAARLFLGVPYLWGGRSAFGVDCSGLTQLAYGLIGVQLPRDAYLQAAWSGAEAVVRSEVRAGDLVFFGGSEDPRGRGITHVGLALDGARMIHASGAAGVEIGEIDAAGRAYRCARRVTLAGGAAA
jgi:gamma-D-glutamyl-L-lysine dipeptidyl-peptidase